MMIKTPVHASTDGLDYDDNVIYEKYVFDENGDFVCESDSPEFALEIVKRINMHDELSLALKDLIEIVGELEESDAERINKSFRWICEIHQNAIKVLEKCK